MDRWRSEVLLAKVTSTTLVRLQTLLTVLIVDGWEFRDILLRQRMLVHLYRRHRNRLPGGRHPAVCRCGYRREQLRRLRHFGGSKCSVLSPKGGSDLLFLIDTCGFPGNSASARAPLKPFAWPAFVPNNVRTRR